MCQSLCWVPKAEDIQIHHDQRGLEGHWKPSILGRGNWGTKVPAQQGKASVAGELNSWEVRFQQGWGGGRGRRPGCRLGLFS